jgi:hypothetical protein
LVTGARPNVQDDAAAVGEHRPQRGRDIFGEFLPDGEPQLSERTVSEGFEVRDEQFGRSDGGLEEN